MKNKKYVKIKCKDNGFVKKFEDVERKINSYLTRILFIRNLQ